MLELYNESNQKSNQLIIFQEKGVDIHQRAIDGYVNATAMCKAYGKEFYQWHRLITTKHYLEDLEKDFEEYPRQDRSLHKMQPPLIEFINTGENDLRGTWVHHEVAVEIAGWLSNSFKIKVNRVISNWLSGNYTISPKKYIPPHLKRYIVNRQSLRKTHPECTSSLQEITIDFIGPLEMLGCVIPKEVMPDISLGLTFRTYMQKFGVDTSTFKKYKHYYEDGRVVDATAIPDDYVGKVKKYLNSIWVPLKSFKYFCDNFPEGIPYLKKLFESLGLDTSKFDLDKIPELIIKRDKKRQKRLIQTQMKRITKWKK